VILTGWVIILGQADEGAAQAQRYRRRDGQGMLIGPVLAGSPTIADGLRG
jgi:hypothetical protein